MKIPGNPESRVSDLRSYGGYLLVFLAVLFIGLTFAHPELLLNDEWITVNQLHQIHDGHQVIINEGKYGLYENGTPNAYFTARENRLAYSLFLPVISLPSLWLVDIFGDYFSFFVLYLWTFLLLAFILFIHYLAPEYRYYKNRCWTPAAAGAVFIIFFLNLLYYVGYSVNDPRSYPEITAIVFTNILLLALAGVIIYEINRTLFEDSMYSLFGTVVCLSSSSYIFWATGCKDHVLTILLFVAILLCMVKFQKNQDIWLLPLAFLITGLLSWARPELALWVAFALFTIWAYSFYKHLQKKEGSGTFTLLCSPLFTFVGALPFFLNNILITNNPLMPTSTIYYSSESPLAVATGSPGLQQGGSASVTSLYQVATLNSAPSSSNILGDLLGLLFHPANGSMGVFSLTPFFLLMALLAGILLLSGKMDISRDELGYILVLVLLAVPVFLAYSNNLYQLNMSRGITPDIRYLSPIYVPLTLIGLVIFRKAQLNCENPLDILKKMALLCLFGIPIAVYVTSCVYADTDVAAQLDAPLSCAFTIVIFSAVVLALGITIMNYFSKRQNPLPSVLLAFICAIPFIWQIDASIRFLWFGATFQGYTFWIPVMRVLCDLFSSPLFR